MVTSSPLAVLPDAGVLLADAGVLPDGLADGGAQVQHRPSRAILSRLRLASPCGCSRNGPVWPRNWSTSRCRLTMTPAGLKCAKQDAVGLLLHISQAGLGHGPTASLRLRRRRRQSGAAGPKVTAGRARVDFLA